MLIQCFIQTLQVRNMKNQLPTYNIQVIDGKYPFKNAHITKIFDIQVYQMVSQQQHNLKQIIDVFSRQKNESLINFSKIQKQQNGNLKVFYEYVETPIHQYIRRYINDSIQIKMENLLVALRELVYKFITNKVNVIEGISIGNFGVKMIDGYRQSMMVGTKKQFVMPEFKIFIDLSKCTYVDRLEEVGKLTLQTDKHICSMFRQKIDQILQKTIKQHQEQLYRFQQKDSVMVDFKKKMKTNEKGLEFTHKRRKIRKNEKKVQSKQTTVEMEKQPQTVSQVGKQEDLKKKIDKLVQKSRLNLKIFRDKFL